MVSVVSDGPELPIPADVIDISRDATTDSPTTEPACAQSTSRSPVAFVVSSVNADPAAVLAARSAAAAQNRAEKMVDTSDLCLEKRQHLVQLVADKLNLLIHARQELGQRECLSLVPRHAGGDLDFRDQFYQSLLLELFRTQDLNH